MDSPSLLERCSQLDLEIKARQEQFGVELYDLFELLDVEGSSFPHSTSFLHKLKVHWIQVNEDIVKYHRRMPEKNKRRRLRVGSINSAVADQWSLQRRQKFGVDCFDIVWDVLGTHSSSEGSNGTDNGDSTTTSRRRSLLTDQEKRIHALIKKAVQDVLELERTKETIVSEVEVGQCQDHQFCGTLEVLCPIYSLCG